MKLSILIPHLPFCKEANEMLGECIINLLQHTKSEFEIILVINGLEKYPFEYDYNTKQIESLKIIESQKQLGTPKGWNLALNNSTGDIVCFMNNDIIVTEGWDLPCIKRLEDEPDVGLVAPDVWLMNPNPPHDWFTLRNNQQGSCMFLKRFFLEELKKPYKEDPGCWGFDEIYEPGYADDDDLFMRVKIRGFHRVMALDSKVYHKGAQTFKKIFPDVQKIANISRATYEKKWRMFGDKKWSLRNEGNKR